jgi:hypothetical protein
MFNLGKTLTISLVISTGWLNLQSSTAEIFAHELRLAQSSVSILGKWENVDLSNDQIVIYKIFQKDGRVLERSELRNNSNIVGKNNVRNYQINSNGVIRIFNELKESCVVKGNEMQCFQNGTSGELGHHKRR